jgi:Skp family chaperone for outer membrane proteins
MDGMNGRSEIRWYEVIIVVAMLVLLLVNVFYMMYPRPRVGVVDVDRVFKDVGMVNKIEADRKQLDAFNRGTAMLQAYNKRMADLNKKLETATPADKDKTQAQIRATNEAFQKSIGPIQNELQMHENLVISSFRRRLQPFVARVSGKHSGLDVVMYAGANILYMRRQVDLNMGTAAGTKKPTLE